MGDHPVQRIVLLAGGRQRLEVRGDAGPQPAPDALDAFRVQATTTRIYAGLMALIDGKRSLKDMAKILVGQQVLTPADAEPAVRRFLTKMYQESQRGQRL